MLATRFVSRVMYLFFDSSNCAGVVGSLSALYECVQERSQAATQVKRRRHVSRGAQGAEGWGAGGGVPSTPGDGSAQNFFYLTSKWIILVLYLSWI